MSSVGGLRFFFLSPEMAVLRAIRYIQVVILASPRNVGKDRQSWRTISWNRSFLASGSVSYIRATLWMRPWCWLTSWTNFFSSGVNVRVSVGFFLPHPSQIEQIVKQFRSGLRLAAPAGCLEMKHGILQYLLQERPAHFVKTRRFCGSCILQVA